MNPLNAQDFGFLPTNSGTDNRFAFAEAVTAAQAQGKPLYIPAGTYVLELTPNDNKGVILTQSVTIFGDGPDHTVIDVHPKIVSFPYTVIWWNTPDLHVTVKGLKVLGPTGTNNEFPDQTPQCSFMEGLTTNPFGNDNRITIDDLTVTGKFTTIIHTANGDGLVEVRNSNLTALSVCVAVFETTNSFMNKRFHADNCRFSSGVPATKTSDHQPFGICVYLHPHVAARVTNCRFYDNPRAAIKQYGESAVGNAPKYSQYLGCHFFNCTTFTIITPGENIVTLIEACSFEQGYIACRNKTNVIGCEFRNSSGIRTTAGHREQQFEVSVIGCWVDQPSASNIAFEDTNGMSLLVRDCVFSFGEGSGEAVGVSLGRATYGEVSGCRFAGRTTTVPHASSGILLGPSDGSRLKVVRCSFTGNFHLAGIVIQPNAESASVEVNECDFSQVAGAPIHFNSGSVSLGNVIRGRDNIFNDKAMTTGGVATNMTAHLRPRLAIATDKVVPVQAPPENPAGPPKFQLVLDRSFNTYHVGGARIDYVFIGTSQTERNKFEGPVHLIAESAWVTTKQGNIRPRTLTPRALKEVVTLLFDPATGLWYEE